MKIISLNDDLYDYLGLVVKRYAGGGIDLDEGLGLYHLWQALKGAVDTAELLPQRENSMKQEEGNLEPITAKSPSGAV